MSDELGKLVSQVAFFAVGVIVGVAFCVSVVAASVLCSLNAMEDRWANQGYEREAGDYAGP